MKKFILNLLTVFAWIYQILCVVDTVMVTILTVAMLVLRSNPDFREGVTSVVNIKDVSVDRYMWVMIIMLILSIITFVAEFLICRYARLIVKNIKQEVYFANTNLNLYCAWLIDRFSR